jgi:general secretion pathway protein G
MGKGHKGFTLVELLVVIAILGVLAGTVTVAVVKHLDNAKVERARIDIANLKAALKTYYIHVGSYPSASEGLQALITSPAGLAGTGKWKGPYLDANSVPKDPWGNEYVYNTPGEEGRDFDITAYGKDGQAGGEGLNADITSYNVD